MAPSTSSENTAGEAGMGWGLCCIVLLIEYWHNSTVALPKRSVLFFKIAWRGAQ